MKNTIAVLFVILLSACQTIPFVPYDGHKTITGDGGFVRAYIPASDLGHSVFSKPTEYKYNEVTFYESGLPAGKKCALVGYYATHDLSSFAKLILELDANVATKSTIHLPVKFDNNAGTLDGSYEARDWHNKYGKVADGFHIFECE